MTPLRRGDTSLTGANPEATNWTVRSRNSEAVAAARRYERIQPARMPDRASRSPLFRSVFRLLLDTPSSIADAQTPASGVELLVLRHELSKCQEKRDPL